MIDKAKLAVNKEWDQLDAIRTWDYSSVASLRDKQNEAAASSDTYRVGRVFPLCQIKHSEMESK